MHARRPLQQLELRIYYTNIQGCPGALEPNPMMRRSLPIWPDIRFLRFPIVLRRWKQSESSRPCWIDFGKRASRHARAHRSKTLGSCFTNRRQPYSMKQLVANNNISLWSPHLCTERLSRSLYLSLPRFALPTIIKLLPKRMTWKFRIGRCCVL